MIRKRWLMLSAFAALTLAACSRGPMNPMPGDDDMMEARVAQDTAAAAR